MNKGLMVFLAGALLGPLVLMFGKFIIFAIGLAAVVWFISIYNEEKANDDGIRDSTVASDSHNPTSET